MNIFFIFKKPLVERYKIFIKINTPIASIKILNYIIGVVKF